MEKLIGKHTPVLVDEVCEFFSSRVQASAPTRLLDCTLGSGGHSRALLALDGQTTLIGLDRDREALERAAKNLAEFAQRIELIHGSFMEIGELMLGVAPFDFILTDLGISSDQLADSSRGFSFEGAGPLDMRMDASSGLTASEVLNDYSPGKLRSVFERGGLRRNASKLTNSIIQKRPIKTTTELAEICEQVIPRYTRRKTGAKASSRVNPATVPFQAIRIEVNQEMLALKSFLRAAPELLRARGRLAVICFHSLEDRLVTRTMRSWEHSDMPAKLRAFSPAGVAEGKGRLLTKKAVLASLAEVELNPRARSARLRVFEMH